MATLHYTAAEPDTLGDSTPMCGAEGHNVTRDRGRVTCAACKATPPTGRSDYRPGTARVGEPAPQSHPEQFSSEDILAEVKHLLRLNKRYGSSPLRTIAYSKLLGVLADRGYTG